MVVSTMAIPNRDRPVSEVAAFVQRAKETGIYIPSQATNLSQSLKVVIDQAERKGVDVSKMTVGQALDQMQALLNEYGASSRANPQTVDTYRGRAAKLCDDFIKYNEGDFFAWKRELAKAPKPVKAKGKSRAVSDAAGVSDSIKVELETDESHVLRLPGGKLGKLVLPKNITSLEINAAWKQLDAYRTLLETQAEIQSIDPDNEVPQI